MNYETARGWNLHRCVGGRRLEAVSKLVVRRVAHRAAPSPLQIDRVEAPGEPAVDRSEKIASLPAVALVAQPRARGGRVRYCSFDSDRQPSKRDPSLRARRRHPATVCGRPLSRRRRVGSVLSPVLMIRLRQLVRSPSKGGFLAVYVAYSLAIQAMMASVGLGMSAGAAPPAGSSSVALLPIKAPTRRRESATGISPFAAMSVLLRRRTKRRSCCDYRRSPGISGLCRLTDCCDFRPYWRRSIRLLFPPSAWRASRSSGFLRLTLNLFRFCGALLIAYGVHHAHLSKLAFAAMLIGFVAPALLLPFAQGTGNTSITVEQPWARATPSGAKTGAVYMTIDNKSGTADRLTGVSSDVADKLQIHEMKVENGVMQMREICRRPAHSGRRIGGAQARQLPCDADWTEETAHRRRNIPADAYF